MIHDIPSADTDLDRSAQPKRRQQRPPQRPLGVTLIVIVLVLGAIAAAFQIAALRSATVSVEQQVGDERSVASDPEFAELFRGFNEQLRRDQQQQVALQMWIYACSIPINLVLAVGLWRLKSWARQLMIAVGALSVMLVLLVDMSGISAVISLVIIIYLQRSPVRSAFQHSAVVERSRLLS